MMRLQHKNNPIYHKSICLYSNRDSFWLNTFFVEKPNEYFLRKYYLSLTRQSKLIEKKVCTILHNRVKWRIMTILILRFLIIIYLIILSSRLNQNFSGLDFYTVNQTEGEGQISVTLLVPLCDVVSLLVFILRKSIK